MKKLICFLIALLPAIVFAGQQEKVVSNGPVNWPQYYNGTNFHHPRVDAKTRSIATITYAHHKIHTGNHYFVEGFDGDMGSGVSKAFTVYVPVGAAIPHMQFAVTSNKILEVYIYEETGSGATCVQAGTGSPVTAINNNRNSNNTSGVHITLNPNIYNTGVYSGNSTYLASMKFGTAAPGNQLGLGGDAGHENEIMLKSGTTTIYQFISREASAIVSYHGWWYEHTPEED